MQPLKDKRTKEQILKLLDHAMEQEERLGEKIKTLESELKDCRKKAEDPRHEITEEALASSKVSFRIDYYRTSEKSPLKGIIEHLPSRQTKAFEGGEGQELITQFMDRFLYEETGKTKKKKPMPKAAIEQAHVPESEVESSLFNLPDIEYKVSPMPVSLEELPVLSTAEYDALFGEVASPAILQQPASAEIPAPTPPEMVKKVDRPAIEAALETSDSRLVRKLKAKLGMDDLESDAPLLEETATNVASEPPSLLQTAKEHGLLGVGKEPEVKQSRLINKLKAKLATDDLESDAPLTQKAESTPPPSSPRQQSARIERLLAKIDAETEIEQRKPMAAPPQRENAANESKPRLLQRLREEYNNSLNQVKA